MCGAHLRPVCRNTTPLWGRAQRLPSLLEGRLAPSGAGLGSWPQLLMGPVFVRATCIEVLEKRGCVWPWYAGAAHPGAWGAQWGVAEVVGRGRQEPAPG